EPLLDHYESLGIPVISPVAACRFGKSKGLQVELFDRLGLRYPRTVVVSHRGELVKASAGSGVAELGMPDAGCPGERCGRVDSGGRAGLRPDAARRRLHPACRDPWHAACRRLTAGAKEDLCH